VLDIVHSIQAELHQHVRASYRVELITYILQTVSVTSHRLDQPCGSLHANAIRNASDACRWCGYDYAVSGGRAGSRDRRSAADDVDGPVAGPLHGPAARLALPQPRGGTADSRN
jgi:hypothetical protein